MHLRDFFDLVQRHYPQYLHGVGPEWLVGDAVRVVAQRGSFPRELSPIDLLDPLTDEIWAFIHRGRHH